MSSLAARPSTSSQDPSHITLGIVGSDRSRRRLARAFAAAGLTATVSVATPEELARSVAVDVTIGYGAGDTEELLRFVRALSEALPQTTLIVVLPPAFARDARRALRAGAEGLISEADLERTLMPTIRAVRSGLVCVPQCMRGPVESETLSMREKQVLGMVVMGLSNSDIATKLYLAESTVKSHLSSAYTKLGVRCRKDAASMVLDPAEGLGPGILAISAG